MKQRSFQFTAFIAIAVASVTGCGAGDIGADSMQTVDDSSENMSLGSLEQGITSCLNLDGTNSVMAALAVAVAQDLGRWQTGKDFVLGNSGGEILALASGSDASGPIGKSRCADGKCARVQAILDMQLDVTANKVYLQGSGNTKVLVNPSALRSRMVSKWREQKDYDSRAQDGVYYQAPKEEHKLAFVGAAKGGCDTNYTFKATKTTGAALLYPNQLKWKLAFADINNPYLGFTNLGGGNVSVDPTYGLNQDDSTSTGSCTAACTKVSVTSVTGQCCSCGGVSKKFTKSSWNATTFLCL